MQFLELRLATDDGPEVPEIVDEEQRGSEDGCRQEPGQAARLGPDDPGDDHRREERVQQARGETEGLWPSPPAPAASSRDRPGVQERQGRDQRQGRRPMLPESLARVSPEVRAQKRGHARRAVLRDPAPTGAGSGAR